MMVQIKMDVSHKGTELVECERCGKNVDYSNIVTVCYSLKRGARRPSENWCKRCRKEGDDDFCNYCGANSLGSIPCAGCRRGYYR